MFKSFFKNDPQTIYLLDGVEDYLTESAKKHKRNLIYASFICATLSVLGIGQTFKSIFGFQLTTPISNDSLLLLLSLTCVYEIIMLISYWSHCRSHWFGKNLQRKFESDGMNRTGVEKFKANIELSHHINGSQLSNREVIKNIEDFSAESISMINAKFREMKNTLKETYPTYGFNSLPDQDKHTQILERIEDAISIMNNFNSDWNTELEEKNRIWNEDIQSICRKINHSYDEILKELRTLKTSPKRFIFLDFILPISIGLLSITLAGLSILTPSLVQQAKSSSSFVIETYKESLSESNFVVSLENKLSIPLKNKEDADSQ